jgi:hypothetical protein
VRWRWWWPAVVAPPADPPPTTRKNLYNGYFGTGDGQVVETIDHISLLAPAPWCGRGEDCVIEQMQQARALAQKAGTKPPDVLLGVTEYLWMSQDKALKHDGWYARRDHPRYNTAKAVNRDGNACLMPDSRAAQRMRAYLARLQATLTCWAWSSPPIRSTSRISGASLPDQVTVANSLVRWCSASSG